MMEESTQNSNPSIIKLFQKMNSNVTDYYTSVRSSQAAYKKRQLCSCHSDDGKQIQLNFYNNQAKLVKSTLKALDSSGEKWSFYSKFLDFMLEYLEKIVRLINQKNQICTCKQKIIDQASSNLHKIGFLREQNHKFFKLVEQKTQQCEQLRQKLSSIQTRMLSNMTHSSSGQSLVQSDSQSVVQKIAISSISSRISQFKHFCPDLTIKAEFDHKRYFNQNISRYSSRNQREPCKQISSSIDNNTLGSTFRKIKIFQH